MSFDADGVTGVRVVDPPPATHGAGEFGEPCYGCDCCRKWTETLELLRAHVIAHNERVKPMFPCPDECLVCQSSSWATT